jgi:hypothetical protein
MHEHLIAPRPVRIVSNPMGVYGAMRRPTPVAQMRLVTPPVDQLAILKLDPDNDLDPDIRRASPGSPR